MSKKFLAFLFCALAIIAALIIHFKQDHPNGTKKLSHHRFVIKQANAYFGFNLVDPEQSPLPIREDVMQGYRLIMDTPALMPEYAGNELSCSNCHFAGGDTIGGKNNGLSLVGAVWTFPKFSSREGKIISLEDRINNCFMRSLNGRPLPEGAEEMHDIIAYLTWISQEVKEIKNIPWLGIKLLKNQHQPDAKQGALVYQRSCAMCHRENGEGGGVIISEDKTIPPLWGPNSFNDGAGMNRLPMFAGFVYANMPYLDACLTEEEALDVAAYVLSKPHPHFTPPQKK